MKSPGWGGGGRNRRSIECRASEDSRIVIVNRIVGVLKVKLVRQVRLPGLVVAIFGCFVGLPIPLRCVVYKLLFPSCHGFSACFVGSLPCFARFGLPGDLEVRFDNLVILVGFTLWRGSVGVREVCEDLLVE